MDALEIERIAADWITQRAGDGWSALHQARLDAWMNESLAHRIAYVRADAIWNEVGRLQAIRPAVANEGVPPRGISLKWVPPASPSQRGSPLRAKRRATLPFAALAASLLAAVVGVWLYSGDILNLHRHSTPVGRIETVALADGSKVILNTDSRIRIDITAEERRVVLDRGEAFFDVAKDSTRPFIVDIGDRQVVAVGTQFSVRRASEDIRVIVTEGAVRVRPKDGSQSELKLLRAGDAARIRARAVVLEQRPLPQVEESLSWRQGYLVFRESPLEEAVAEFNRYNTRKMVIADPTIAALKIGGHFRATGTDVFLWMLQNGFPVAVQESEDEVLLRGR